MAPVRVLFVGNAEACVPWVGLAKKLSRQCYHAGVINKTYKVADGVQIRVENVLPAVTAFGNKMGQDFGAICKVWIEAGGYLSGYQFYTTSPQAQWAVWKTPTTDFYPGGSVVEVPTPKLILNPDGSVDYEKTHIYAIPRGSSVERSGSANQWPWIVHDPSLLTGEYGLIAAMYSLFPVKGVWQVNGIPEYTYYETETKVPTTSLLVNDPLVVDKYKLHQSWVQQGGHISGASAYFPIEPRHINDEYYDVAPGKIKGKGTVTQKAPDTDWFGRACTQVVGGKRFIILYDTKGDWYCWPEDAFLDPSKYEGQYGTYADTGYKANVVPQAAKKVTPEYPAWVVGTISWRDTKLASPDEVIYAPRYSLSFNSDGTKAVGVLIEREKSQCTFYETNYTIPNLATAEPPYSASFLPTEVLIDPLKLDRSYITDGGPHHPMDLYADRRGYIEFRLRVVLTEVDFNFFVEITDDRSPDELGGLEKGALVDVAYARALDWTDLTLSRLGAFITEDTYEIHTDDVLSVWVELFQHEDEKAVMDGFDGEMSLHIPSKAKAVFYKNLSFDEKLFCLPLSQAHGQGYTYSPVDGAFPAPPHDFVNNTNQTLGSRYPFSEPLYYYSGSIDHLDLSTLSFYHTVRILEQKSEEYQIQPLLLNQLNNINNKAKTVCAVCVMGRLIEDYSVGHEDIPVDWARGWRRSAGNSPLDEGEERIPANLIHNLRGFGAMYSGSITGESSPGVTPFGHTSWINYLGGGSIEIRPDYLGCFPWWLNGPCGHITHLALSLAIMKSYYGGGSASFVHSGITTSITFTVPSIGLFDMVKADMTVFAEFLYGLYGTYLGITTESAVTSESRLSDYYGTNPFALACSEIDVDRFSEMVKGYLWIVVSRLQATSPSSIDTTKGFGFQVAMAQGMKLNLGAESVLPRGDGLIRPGDNYNSLLYPRSLTELTEKQIAVKGIELGTLFYNKAILQYFHGFPIHKTEKILITPEGHVSYSRKSIYDLKIEFCTQRMYYMNMPYDFEPGIPNAELIPPQRTPYSQRLENTTSPIPTSTDMDWKLVDGLSWFYGALKTKHLWMYNLAYQDYADKASKIKYLHHTESLTHKYSEVDFMPDFRFDLFSSYAFFYPHTAENGRFAPLQILGLPKESGLNNTSAGAHPFHEPRYRITEIRLSPLFF